MLTEIELQLKEIVEVFDSYEKEKIFRTSLGKLSIESELKNELGEIADKNKIAVLTIKFVSSNVAQKYMQTLSAINSQLNQLANYSDQSFSQSCVTQIQNIRNYLNSLREIWPNFYVLFLEKSPSEAINLTGKLQERLNFAESALEKVDKLTGAASTTVQKVSYVQVQDIWDRAKDGACWKAFFSGLFAVIGLCLFFCTIQKFKAEVDFIDDAWTWKIAYMASIRLVMLGAIAALISFFVGLLRSYLQLYESNLHKLRITNAIPVFQNSVNEDKQDELFIKLIESLINFTDPGFLKNEFKTTFDKLPSIDGKAKDKSGD